MPDPFVAQLCIDHIDRAFQQVIVDEKSNGVLLYANKARYGSCPEHLAWVSRLSTILTADSACPLLLGFLGEDVLCLMFQSLVNSAKRWLANWGPLSDRISSGMPCSANSSFSTAIVLALLHCDIGIFHTIGIFE